MVIQTTIMAFPEYSTQQLVEGVKRAQYFYNSIGLTTIYDPVGALAVHLVNGIWGTLAVGLFAVPKYLDGTAGLF